jgi:hypothetical protein
MNRILKEATVRRNHYETHAQLREHEDAFLSTTTSLSAEGAHSLRTGYCKVWDADTIPDTSVRKPRQKTWTDKYGEGCSARPTRSGKAPRLPNPPQRKDAELEGADRDLFVCCSCRRASRAVPVQAILEL